MLLHTGSLHILARQNALTDGDWFTLLERRRELIIPHLRDITLKSLGDLKIVRDQMGGHSSERPLRMGAMVYSTSSHRKHRDAGELKIAEGPFGLETRGIWPDDDVYYQGHFNWQHIYKGGGISASGLVTRFWGLTRNNQWIKAECTERYFSQARNPGHDDRPEERSEVVKFVTSESTPGEICRFCNISPRWIWLLLGDSIEKWLTRRKSQFAAVQQLVDTFGCEKTLLGIIEPDN